MRSESSIGEALTRIAETFSRLLVQHLQLLRSELESEGRDVAARARAVGVVAAIALPFVIAGVAIATLGLGDLLGFALEPWLGRVAVPLSLIACGIAESVVAGWWLRRIWVRSARPVAASADVTPPEVPHTDRSADERPDRMMTNRLRRTVVPALTPVAFEEKPYGSMG